MSRRYRFSFAAALAIAFALLVGAVGCGREGLASPVVAQPADPAQPVVSGPKVVSIENALEARRGEDRGFVDVASAYLQKARDTGDPAYYPKVEGLVNAALQKDPNDADALILMGMLCLGRHQFEAALAWGQKARAANPNSTPSLGVIGDAQNEMGRYDAGVRTIQDMVDARPDLSSYARVSYIRELHGDVPGAIYAMQQAIEAGGPVPENVAYPTVILGNLYFESGNLTQADTAYRSALAVYPNYVHAEAGLARIRAAQGNWPESIRLYREVVDRYPSPEYVIALGDVYAASGDRAKASESYDLAAAEQKLYQSNGINVDAELALFQADHHRDLAGALAAARRAIVDRNSVMTADVLSWTLYQTGSLDEALRYAHEANRLGTRSALFAFHQGMIEYRLGDWENARVDLANALRINPYFSPIHASEARDALATLDGAPPAQTTADSGESHG